jgi:hypothetical protein
VAEQYNISLTISLFVTLTLDKYYRELQSLKSFQDHLLNFNKQEQAIHESTFVKRLDLYHQSVVQEYITRGEKSWLTKVMQVVDKLKPKEANRIKALENAIAPNLPSEIPRIHTYTQ